MYAVPLISEYYPKSHPSCFGMTISLYHDVLKPLELGSLLLTESPSVRSLAAEKQHGRRVQSYLFALFTQDS